MYGVLLSFSQQLPGLLYNSTRSVISRLCQCVLGMQVVVGAKVATGADPEGTAAGRGLGWEKEFEGADVRDAKGVEGLGMGREFSPLSGLGGLRIIVSSPSGGEFSQRGSGQKSGRKRISVLSKRHRMPPVEMLS